MTTRFPRGAGIVGAGPAGLLHALAFRAHGVPVVAVFDPDRTRARHLAGLVGEPRVFDDLEALAGEGRVDCISICSPPRYHVSQAELCARLRDDCLVFVEKPVAIARAEMKRVERLPRAVPVVQWRAGRAIRTVRRALAEGLLGPTPSVAVDLAWHRDDAYFADDRGRARYDRWGCGALLSVGIHALDAVCFALDRPVADVHGSLGFSNGIEVETRAALVAAFRGGAMATLRLTFDAAVDQTRITFCGGGVTATICGDEADPTASTVQWLARDPVKLRKLRELEAHSSGSSSGPLLVPFIGDAIRAACEGRSSGSVLHFPSMSDVAVAHAAIFHVYEGGARAFELVAKKDGAVNTARK